MKIAMIGLGKMGGAMTKRLLNAGVEVVGYDQSQEIVNQLASDTKMTPVRSLDDLEEILPSPRIIWLMIPAGKITSSMVTHFAQRLSRGDILIDGGNSNFNDTLLHHEILAKTGIELVDVGVSGGVWGLSEGYSLMIGGNPDVISRLSEVFIALAPGNDRGWGRVGPVGAGHYAKMVHNGIEYGLMEAYGEGFELLQSRPDFDFDLHQVSEIWRYSSVIRSWLLDLISRVFAENKDLSGIKGWLADSGEGRWTVNEAISQGVPVPAIAVSLFRRFESRQPESFSAKLLAAVRNQFGGHSVVKKE